jgi:hypothetical protein
MIDNGKIEEVMEKYKKKILKDNDFNLLKCSLNLSQGDGEFLLQNMSSDAEFLKGYKLTDYSCLLSMHKYTQDDYERCVQNKNYRVMKSKDNKYLYNFSVIDFLCVNHIIIILGVWAI